MCEEVDRFFSLVNVFFGHNCSLSFNSSILLHMSHIIVGMPNKPSNALAYLTLIPRLFLTSSLSTGVLMLHFLATSACVIPDQKIIFIKKSPSFITIPPSFRKTFRRITRIHSCILAFPLLEFHNLCCGTHNSSNRKAFLSTYGLLLVYLSQAKSIQLRAYIRLLSLSYLFLHRFSEVLYYFQMHITNYFLLFSVRTSNCSAGIVPCIFF